MATQPQLFKINLSPNNKVYTPGWVAEDIVAWFKPTGRILEPCRGQQHIFRRLPSNAMWCEIDEGVDFFDWTEEVDWIITNPPFDDFKKWLTHCFEIAENNVLLIPHRKLFSGYLTMELCWKYGWLKHVRTYGPGTKLNFPMGNAIGALHFVRGYWGDTSWSWYDDQKP